MVGVSVTPGFWVVGGVVDASRLRPGGGCGVRAGQSGEQSGRASRLARGRGRGRVWGWGRARAGWGLWRARRAERRAVGPSEPTGAGAGAGAGAEHGAR